ncbi:hypothetical protein [Neorhizobium galegae]|uniref:hypothetical protein n=1 Tax=Neorhizobium galegae TaxID=399 RepID=UPI0012767B58|nr:hypothetical protein [Neorhizobium galegae]KAA9386926.1 hypothetical protein F4V88_10820 [Neorhizobium galegae]MCM2499905.1 hypothetical protein [Neorhizobium galegae]
MNSERLGNLLNEIDKRLGRLGKSLGDPIDEMHPNSGVAKQIAALRAETRRQTSKIDTLKSADVDQLEAMVGDLREAASRALPSSHSVVHPVKSILTDEVGLTNLISGLRIGLTLLGPDDVLEVVPGQKTAAFQFGFTDDVLTVVDQPLRPHQREEVVALAALEAAIEQGDYVNQDLEQTNVSPRLRDGFLRLQAALASRRNIVLAGARAQICVRLVNGESDELSPSLTALLLGHLEGVSSALAQFQEWRAYCENAFAMNVDPDSVRKVAESARSLAHEVKKTSAIDPSVSDALETVVGWVETEPAPDKRDVLSLVRSLENIWSAVTKALLSLGKEVLSEARKLAAKAIVGLLLTTAAVAIPVLGKLPGSEWIQTAYTFFKGTEPPKVP